MSPSSRTTGPATARLPPSPTTTPQSFTTTLSSSLKTRFRALRSEMSVSKQKLLGKKPTTTRPLSTLFHSLPAELQVQILTYLPLHSLLALTLTSPRLHSLVRLHAPYLAARLLNPYPTWQTHLHITPHLTPTPPSLPLLVCMHDTAASTHHLASTLTTEIMRELLGKRRFLHLEKELKQYIHQRIRTNMYPFLYNLVHFFEQARTHPPARILAAWEDQTLLSTHLMWQLLLHLCFRRFRKQGVFTSWPRPGNAEFAIVLEKGGVRELGRLFCVQGARRRREEWRRVVKGGLARKRLAEMWTPVVEAELGRRGVGIGLGVSGCGGLFVRALLVGGEATVEGEMENWVQEVVPWHGGAGAWAPDDEMLESEDDDGSDEEGSEDEWEEGEEKDD